MTINNSFVSLPSMKSTATYIKKTIAAIQPGKLMTYSDFKVQPSQLAALAKTLSRLAQQGEIIRLEKGLYYKPQKSVFGNLRPSENEILRAITSGTDGYISGYGAFNNLGLTTQMASQITIATINKRPIKQLGGLKIRFIKASMQGNPKNTLLLQILDAIKNIKRIPDSLPDETLRILIKRITQLSNDEKKELINIALKYNPSTRSIIGAIYENYMGKFNLTKIENSLNPLSSYKIGISESILPNKRIWRII